MRATGLAPFAAPTARTQAVSLLDQIVQGQSMILAFEDVFVIVGVIFIVAMPLLLLFKNKKLASQAKPAEAAVME
jgi:DHA2 family multidrug resistance protein